MISDASSKSPVKSIHWDLFVLSPHLSSQHPSQCPFITLAAFCTRLPLVLVPLEPTLMGLNSVGENPHNLAFHGTVLSCIEVSTELSKGLAILLSFCCSFLSFLAVACQTQITELTQADNWDRNSDSDPEVPSPLLWPLPCSPSLAVPMEEVASSCPRLTPPFSPSAIWVLFSPTFPGTFPCWSYHLIVHIFILSPWGSFLTDTDKCKPFLKTDWQGNHLIHPPSPSSYHPQLTVTIRSFFFNLHIVDPQCCATSRYTAKWLRLIDSFFRFCPL